MEEKRGVVGIDKKHISSLKKEAKEFRRITYQKIISKPTNKITEAEIRLLTVWACIHGESSW